MSILILRILSAYFITIWIFIIIMQFNRMFKPKTKLLIILFSPILFLTSNGRKKIINKLYSQKDK